jgi:hypothetical protein
MDKRLTRFESLSDMKDAPLRDWQSRSGHERIAAISEITTAAVFGLQRILVQVKRAQG